jgi:hypothetical protein
VKAKIKGPYSTPTSPPIGREEVWRKKSHCVSNVRNNMHAPMTGSLPAARSCVKSQMFVHRCRRDRESKELEASATSIMKKYKWKIEAGTCFDYKLRLDNYECVLLALLSRYTTNK